MINKTPLIRKTPLTNRWVVITKWKPTGTHGIEALERFDIHDELEAIIRQVKKTLKRKKKVKK